MINIGKKCLAALLAASMVFGVTGCGKQKKAKKPYVQSTAEVKNGTAKAEGKGKQQSEVPLIIGCGRLDKNFNPFLAQAASDEQVMNLTQTKLFDTDRAGRLVETVTKKLLNNYGLKSLAKGEENYVEIYEGDSCRRDFSYHQGITWTWLLGPYYNALKRLAKESKNKADRTKFEEQLKEFTANVIKTFKIELNERGCVGSIAEIYDSKRPYEPKGAIAQAWSVAEVFRIISEN